MKLFIDANVIVAVLNKEYPAFSDNARILSLQGTKGYQLYTSPICLAIAFYFAEKKNKRTALQKIKLLAAQIGISPVNDLVVQQALNDRSIGDFEDGLEYYSAIAAGCHCIITEDIDDFYFSKIDVKRPSAFLESLRQKVSNL